MRMSALQEVVQQLENILKTSNEYGPFVCLDAPAPLDILPLDANGKVIQKNTEASPDLLQCDSNTFISQGLGLDQQDDHEVIIAQSFGEDFVGSLHSDTGSNLLGEIDICDDIRGTTHLNEENNEERVADFIPIPTCNQSDIHLQHVNGASNELLHHESLPDVEEGGKVSADNPIPSTCAVNNLSSIEQLPSSNPLIQTCSESTVPINKDGIDGDDRKEKEDDEEIIIQPPKRKRGRPRKITDPNSIVPKIKRPRGRPRKHPAPDSDVDCILPILTEHSSTKTKHAIPTKVSDELSQHNGVGLSICLEGEKGGTKTTHDIFYVLGLQECDKNSIPTAFNQGAPAEKEQQADILSEGNVISLTGEVNCNDTGDQPSSGDVQGKSHDELGRICPDNENKEAGTLTKICEVQCPRQIEDRTGATQQNGDESADHVEKCEEDEKRGEDEKREVDEKHEEDEKREEDEKHEEDEKNVERKETNRSKVDQPTKRKRGRPKRPVRNIKNLIRRPGKPPTSVIGVAAAALDRDSCAIVIQNFHEDSHAKKDVYPACTQAKNGSTEGGLKCSYGIPVEHSSCKVNNNNTLENETTEGNEEECGQEQRDALSLWEKDTATIKDGKNNAFMEEKVPKLRLRRKTLSETREDEANTVLSTSKAADGNDNSFEKDVTAGNDDSDPPDEVNHNPMVPAMHLDDQCSAVMESEETIVNYPTDNQARTEEILPTTGLTDALPLADLRGQFNPEPELVENPQIACNASGIDNKEQTSAKDESSEIVFSKDTCESPKKRGRGRPRKIRPIDVDVRKDDSGQPTKKRGRGRPRKFRPSEEVVHGIEIKNDASLDSCPTLYPDNELNENVDKTLDMGSIATKTLNDSKVLENVSPSPLNEMAHSKLSGKETQTGSNQVTKLMRNERKTASGISKKPVMVQRVISIVCSSETEVYYSKVFKQRRKPVDSDTHPQRIVTDVPTVNSRELPSYQNKHRSILLRKRCLKKPSVRIKKLPKRLITGSLNLDDPSRLAQLFQHPEKHSQSKTKKGKGVKSQAICGFTHQLLPAKSTPLSSGGRVIAPHTHGNFQSYSSCPQKTIRLNYGDQNDQSRQANDVIGKNLPSHKKIMKHPPLPNNSVEVSEKGKSLLLDRIKKDAAMLRGDFQNKEIQSKVQVGQMTPRARTNFSYEKRGKGRPSKKFVSFGNSVKQKIDDYQPSGPLLISKRLFSFKRKAVRDITLRKSQVSTAIAPKKSILKKQERRLARHAVNSKSTSKAAVEKCGEFRKKLGSLCEDSVASHKQIPNSATCVKIPKKVGRPRKNPHPSDVHVPPKNSTSVGQVKRKPGRPRKYPRPADTFDKKKNSEDPHPCSEVEQQNENGSLSEDAPLVERKDGRQRKKPERLEYTHQQEEPPRKSHEPVDSPSKSLNPESAVQPLVKKRGRPRKYPREEISPRYPSVPLPITDNYLFGGFGFQPSNFPGFTETPSCNFSVPVGDATEVPVLNDELTKSDEKSLGDTNIGPDLVAAVKQSAILEHSETVKDDMTSGLWTPDKPQKDPAPSELSCCIDVTTQPLLPPPPSLNIDIGSTSLKNT